LHRLPDSTSSLSFSSWCLPQFLQGNFVQASKINTSSCHKIEVAIHKNDRLEVLSL
jgi:hypothetical protein